MFNLCSSNTPLLRMISAKSKNRAKLTYFPIINACSDVMWSYLLILCSWKIKWTYYDQITSKMTFASNISWNVNRKKFPYVINKFKLKWSKSIHAGGADKGTHLSRSRTPSMQAPNNTTQVMSEGELRRGNECARDIVQFAWNCLIWVSENSVFLV